MNIIKAPIKHHLRIKRLKYGNNGAIDKPILKVGETFCM